MFVHEAQKFQKAIVGMSLDDIKKKLPVSKTLKLAHPCPLSVVHDRNLNQKIHFWADVKKQLHFFGPRKAQKPELRQAREQAAKEPEEQIGHGLSVQLVQRDSTAMYCLIKKLLVSGFVKVTKQQGFLIQELSTDSFVDWRSSQSGRALHFTPVTNQEAKAKQMAEKKKASSSSSLRLFKMIYKLPNMNTCWIVARSERRCMSHVSTPPSLDGSIRFHQ